MPTIHTLRTQIRVPLDLSGDPDRTVIPADIVFSYEPSGDPDFSNEIGILHAKPANGAAAVSWLLEFAQGALALDDEFYDACCRTAERERSRRHA
jgi:hypothetical protein